MENKKTKLTISGNAKKSIKNIELAKTQNKNSVVIEKKTGKFRNRNTSFNKPSNQNNNYRDKPFKVKKENFFTKPVSAPANDREKRKLAEQRSN